MEGIDDAFYGVKDAFLATWDVTVTDTVATSYVGPLPQPQLTKQQPNKKKPYTISDKTMADQLCALLYEVVGDELTEEVRRRIRDAAVDVGVVSQLEVIDLQQLGFKRSACGKIVQWIERQSDSPVDHHAPRTSSPESAESAVTSSYPSESCRNCDTPDLTSFEATPQKPTSLSIKVPAVDSGTTRDRDRRQEPAERRRLNSDTHVEKIADGLTNLLVDKAEFEVRSPDIEVKVKGKTIKCHKVVLHLASKYFRQVLTANEGQMTGGDVIDLDIPEVNPSAFECVLRFIYRGTVEVEKGMVGDVLIAADVLSMSDLRRLCIDYMLSTVGPETCFDYWRHLESIDWSIETERELVEKCRSVARTIFWRSATNSRPLQGATDNIVETLINDNSLQVRSEQQVCQVLLKWFASRRTSDKYDADEPEPVRFLRCIRWSGVRAEYVKSVVIDDPVIRRSPDALQFVGRVIRYLTTGIQFDGLTTAHRPSTKCERSILTLIGGPDPSMAAVSAQYTGSVEPMLGGVAPPFYFADEAASVVVAGKWLFAIGTGDTNTDIWRFDIAAGWRKWSGRGLRIGRRRHCVAVTTNMNIFVVGGYCPADRSLVSYLERLDATKTNMSCELIDEPHEEIPIPVVSAASAAYGDFIYVFGGVNDRNECVNRVQIFDTLKSSWTVLNFILPVHVGRLNAAVYDDSIIVLGADLNLVFNPITGEWRGRGVDKARLRYKREDDTYETAYSRGFIDGITYRGNTSPGGGTDVSDFGMVIDDSRLFVLGGRRFFETCSSSPSTSSSSDSNLTWKRTDEVRSIDLKLVLSGAALKPGQWSAHAKLPRSTLVTVCGLLTLAS